MSRSNAFPDAGRRPRRRGRRIAAALVVVAAVVALPWVLVRAEPDRLEAARASAPGAFALLSAGRTHYEVAGPDTAQPVVLVHGTTMPALVWDRNFDSLAAAGLRVVRYDLYGRGLSDRPDARHDLELYVAQLAELVAQVAPGRPVDLVGFSLGGIVGAEYARRHPERVRRLALVGPAGVGTALPLAARLGAMPGVGEYVMHVAGTRQLRPSGRNLLHPERHAALDSAYLPTIRFPGSRRAVLETVRHVPMSDYAAGYRELGALGKPILLVWGRHDAVVPVANAERVRTLVRATRLVVVEDAGHAAHYERPEVVNAALREFLLAP